MIEVSHVVKKYDNRNVVNDVSFSVEQGEFISIVGKSGSGKSTLMNIIGSMIRCDSGSVFVDGKNIASFNAKEIAEYRNRTIGFVFQNFHLEPSYTVFENVTLPMEISEQKKHMKDRAKAVLQLVGLSDYSSKKVTTLSGGEQQRVCIARAIIQNPKLLLADEPCGNLDSQNSAVVMQLLRNLADSGCTVLLITHNLDAAAQTDRILTLHDGALISDTRMTNDKDYLL